VSVAPENKKLGYRRDRTGLQSLRR